MKKLTCKQQLLCSEWYPVPTSCLFCPPRHSPWKFPGSEFSFKADFTPRCPKAPEHGTLLSVFKENPCPHQQREFSLSSLSTGHSLFILVINYGCPPWHLLLKSPVNNVWINEETALRGENCGGLNFEFSATAASIKAVLPGLTSAGFYFLRGLELASYEHEWLNSGGMAWKLAQKHGERTKYQMKNLPEAHGYQRSSLSCVSLNWGWRSQANW